MNGSKLSSLQIRKAVFLAVALVVLCFLAFTVESSAAPRRPLAKSEVLDLLHGGVTPARIADLVGQYGIAFQLTRETEKQLREAGADEALLKALRQSASPRTAPPTPAVRPPASQSHANGPPVLLIESNPGTAQVYVDDEPVGTTSAQGRLKLSQFAPGKYQVRVALAGYKDYEETVTLAEGETTRVAPSLEAVKAGLAPTSSPSPEEQKASNPQPAAPAEEETLPAGSAVSRFAVEHDHGLNGTNYCLGWMTIGNGRLQFASQSLPVHSFSVPLSAIQEAEANRIYLSAIDAFHIRFRDGTELNFCVIDAQGHWQSSRELLQTLHRAMGRK